MPQQQYILNRLPIGLLMLDKDYRVTGFSEVAVSMFGADTLHKTLGKTIHSVHSPQSRNKINWLLRQAQKEGTSGFASLLINMPDKVLQLRMIQLKDVSDVSGYCLILYDITDLISRPQKAAPDTDQEAAAGPARPFFKLPISTNGRIGLLDVDQVSYLRAEGHYTQAYSGAKCFFCNLSISQLETRLPTDRFMRVHRSYIINVDRAKSVRHDHDQLIVSMDGDPEQDVPVSRGNISRLRRLLGV